MIVLDRLLGGGVKFVLQRLADTVDGELNDEDRLREHLLNAQLRLELGEIDEDEFVETERDLLARLHDIQLRKREAGGQMAPGTAGAKITGIEISADGIEE